jgi:hypothetical protein
MIIQFHNHSIISQISLSLEQNSIDLMIQHRTEDVCSVDNTKSSNLDLSLEKPSAMSIEFLC